MCPKAKPEYIRTSAVFLELKWWVFGHLAGLLGAYGRGEGIRTLEGLSPQHAFQACALNRSATPLSWQSFLLMTGGAQFNKLPANM